MYLLDSFTISDFMRGEASTTKKLKSLTPSIIYTSTITQMEVTYGLIRRFDSSHRYFEFLKDFLSAITILSFDKNAAQCAACIRKTLEATGQVIGSYDILIAAIALSGNLTLVTSNEKEFSRIDNLYIENWRKLRA